MYAKPLLQLAASVFLVAGVGPVRAESPANFLAAFENEARQQAATFTGFSTKRGEVFFKESHGRDWSCASCHTRNPADSGRHAKTDKPIEPLAPAANAKRFTSSKKVDKWFRRNCNDVVGRGCTGQEKGDVLTYLMSIE